MDLNGKNIFIKGLVIRILGPLYEIEGEGKLYKCRLRGKFRNVKTQLANPIVVGDYVMFILEKNGKGIIEEILPRKTTLSRPGIHSKGHKEQLIVANVEQVIIIHSVKQPHFKPGLIDRFLIAAHKGELEPIICVNKMDLDIDNMIKEETIIYEQIGYKVIYTSAKTDLGLEELREQLKNHTTVLAGQSGVGKSTLLNKIQPNLHLRTREITYKTGKGKHTTTHAKLIRLEFGGYVVDTPGIKVMQLWKVEKRELAEYFIEMIPYLGECKFNDCSHISEPKCAIKEALKEGKISQRRYDSYIHIYESL